MKYGQRVMQTFHQKKIWVTDEHMRCSTLLGIKEIQIIHEKRNFQ